MAAKTKKKGKKPNPKPSKKKVSKKVSTKVSKGKKERVDADEITDLERDVERGEDVEKGAYKRAEKEVVEKTGEGEEEDLSGEYEYGERGILSEEDEYEDDY